MGEIQHPPPPTNISNNNMMDHHHHHTSTNNNSRGSPMVDQRRGTRPQKEQNLNCPRCNSTNTKFCYYNNYSLTQPRYFCKTCRRYWTQGGSLRNVPVGGGSRKNKRPSSSSSPSMILGSSSSSTLASGSGSGSGSGLGLSNALTPTICGTTKLIPDLNPPNTLPHLITPQNPSKFLEAQDLNLAFPIQGIFSGNATNISNSTPTTTTAITTTTTTTPVSALELLKSGIPPSSYVSIPIPDANSPLYPSGLPNLQEFKPNVGVFQATHHGGDHGNGNNGDQNNGVISGANNVVGGARLLFPFADMNKLASSTKTANYDHDDDHHPDQIDEQSNKGGNHDLHQHHHHLLQHHHQGQTGYWTGMLGGGAW